MSEIFLLTQCCYFNASRVFLPLEPTKQTTVTPLDEALTEHSRWPLPCLLKAHIHSLALLTHHCPFDLFSQTGSRNNQLGPPLALRNKRQRVPTGFITMDYMATSGTRTSSNSSPCLGYYLSRTFVASFCL